MSRARTTIEICDRVKELDRLYLAADAIQRDHIHETMTPERHDAYLAAIEAYVAVRDDPAWAASMESSPNQPPPLSKDRAKYVCGSPEARTAWLKTMSEEWLQSSLITEIEALGGSWAHVRDSRGHPVAGLPDIIAVVPLAGDEALILLIELKSQKGRVRDSQRPWLELLSRRLSVIAGLVRPVRTADAVGYDEVLETMGVKR